MVLTNTVDRLAIPTEYINDINGDQLVLQVMKEIYSEDICSMPISENVNICYWIDDEKKAEDIFREEKERFHHGKNKVAIISCNKTFQLPFNEEIKRYYVKNHSLIILVLGYFHYYLNRFPYPEIIVEHNHNKLLNVYRQLLDVYSLQYVATHTGLSKKEIIQIYKYFFMCKPHHQLIMKDRLDELNIQSIRSLCLLPLFQQRFSNNNIIIPLSYDAGLTNFSVQIRSLKDEISKDRKDLMEVKPICMKHAQPPSKKTSMKIYDVQFAEKFDVDPFPLH